MQSNSESKFIHLRCHSEYSITDGIVRLGDYVSLAKELELESLAISDLSNVFAAVKFFKLATSNGIKPIIGADVYIQNEDNRDQPSLCKGCRLPGRISLKRSGYPHLLISSRYRGSTLKSSGVFLIMAWG